MVYRNIGTTHPDATNGTQDYILGRSFGNHDEIGSFTSRRNRDWHQLDLVRVGEPHYSIVRY